MQAVLTQSDSHQAAASLELDDTLPPCDLPGCGKPARLTIDTPNSKDLPICDGCFKRIDSIAGALQKSTNGLTIENIVSLQGKVAVKI